MDKIRTICVFAICFSILIFDAKRKLQIDGINFIELISFNAFNEGTCFKSTIYKAQGLTKTRVKIAGADAIYATNKNRVFATGNNT